MEDKVTVKTLMKEGVHYGHLTQKWNPKMQKYIFMRSEGIHLIDLNKTLIQLEEAMFALKNIAKSGRKIMFVATKKQAREVIKNEVADLDMPYVTERWLGGMLTNFFTIRRSLKKMNQMEVHMKDEAFVNFAKRERLSIKREQIKLDKLLGGISMLKQLPAALFVVDVKREYIAVLEAQKLNIPVFAMVDTNSDPTNIDFPIPSNDDAFRSISVILKCVGNAIREGLSERKKELESQSKQPNEPAEKGEKK